MNGHRTQGWHRSHTVRWSRLNSRTCCPLHRWWRESWMWFHRAQVHLHQRSSQERNCQWVKVSSLNLYHMRPTVQVRSKGLSQRTLQYEIKWYIVKYAVTVGIVEMIFVCICPLMTFLSSSWCSDGPHYLPVARNNFLQAVRERTRPLIIRSDTWLEVNKLMQVVMYRDAFKRPFCEERIIDIEMVWAE